MCEDPTHDRLDRRGCAASSQPTSLIGRLGRLAKSGVLPLAGSFFVLSAIIGLVRGYSPVPLGDMWDGCVQFYMAVSRGEWSQWFSLAGPHRILFSRIFSWLDMRYFGGLSILLLTVNVVLMAILWAELCLAASALLRPRRDLVLVAGSLLLIPTFSWLQYENITWGNQTQFFAAYAFPLAAFQSLAWSVGSRRQRLWFGLALLFGVISAVTMGNGTLALPLLAAMVVATQYHVRIRLLVLVPLAAAILWSYYSGVHGSMHSVAPWQEVLDFALAFLGSPGGSLLKNLPVAVIGGTAFVVGSAYALIAWYRSHERDPMSLALLVFLAYIILSAVAVARARAGQGWDTPLGSRYSTTSLLGWCALAILLIARFRDRPELCGAMWVVSAVVPLAFLPSQLVAWGDVGPKLARARRHAALALNLGIRDTQIIGNIYAVDSPGFESIVADARSQNLSVFGLPDMVRARRCIGLPARDLGLVECAGHVDGRKPIGGDPAVLRVFGWAFDSTNGRVPALVYFADEHGTVIGAAFSGLPRPDLADIPAMAKSAGFEGYVRQYPGGEIQVLRAQ